MEALVLPRSASHVQLTQPNNPQPGGISAVVVPTTANSEIINTGVPRPATSSLNVIKGVNHVRDRPSFTRTFTLTAL